LTFKYYGKVLTIMSVGGT